MVLVLSGRCVPCDSDDPDAVFDGRVFITNDGLIEKITKGSAVAPAGFGAAPVLNAGDGFITPGLIDLHNHIGYNTLPLWAEPKQTVPFAHHDNWTRAPSYGPSISWPANTLVNTEPEAFLAYVQLRALVGGTTAIQGWPGANRKHVQVLRNIDEGPDRSGSNNLYSTSTLTLKGEALAKKAQAQKNGQGFIYHCGEGSVNSLVRREFVDASQAGCLQKNFICIHCNSITRDDWQFWPTERAGAIVWSPFSNLWLYGSTTDITAARGQGILVCIGSDWGPSGTKNVQGEVKAARLASEKFGFGLSDRDLFAMITSNPGDALARVWNKVSGRLVEGGLADVTIMRARGKISAQNSAFKQLVLSTEDDVMLTVVEGIARYGDAGLLAQQLAVPSANFTLGGRERRFAIPEPGNDNNAWELANFTDLLKAVIANPAKAISKAQARMLSFTGGFDEPDAPLLLKLDMPSGGTAFAASLNNLKKHVNKIVVPPLASLVHDKSFFGDIKGRGFHDGLLDKLKGFYQ